VTQTKRPPAIPGRFKRAFEPAGEGPIELAETLASVPLAELNSSSLRDRSSVLPPLAKVAPNRVGTVVKLRRIDSSTGEIIVTVRGLSAKGERVDEEVLLPPGGAAETEQRFLVVNDVLCPEGRVIIGRRYELGTADAGGFKTTADDLPAALAEILEGLPVIGRLRNITSGAQSTADPLDSPGAAWAVSKLPQALFPNAPTAKGAAAVDALLELASLAKFTPDASPILPARVHMLFRGLPGLWACANPNCSEIAPEDRGGPTGTLYAEPRQNCRCGSQVYELHSCRSCGLSVARANVGSPAGVEHLWQDNGSAYAGDTGLIEPIHVCFENPMPQDASVVRPAFLDLSSGRIDGAGSFVREIWLPPQMGRCRRNLRARHSRRSPLASSGGSPLGRASFRWTASTAGSSTHNPPPTEAPQAARGGRLWRPPDRRGGTGRNRGCSSRSPRRAVRPRP
jgi:hypothetical protein